ncbi:hypothetical protein QYF36_017961 [Acer negundo]|nr:hypothetical protein QYF36_017961 [Acer negundo]
MYRLARLSTYNLSISSHKHWISFAIGFRALLFGFVSKSNRCRAASLSGLGFDVYPPSGGFWTTLIVGSFASLCSVGYGGRYYHCLLIVRRCDQPLSRDNFLFDGDW